MTRATQTARAHWPLPPIPRSTRPPWSKESATWLHAPYMFAENAPGAWIVWDRKYRPLVRLGRPGDFHMFAGWERIKRPRTGRIWFYRDEISPTRCAATRRWLAAFMETIPMCRELCELRRKWERQDKREDKRMRRAHRR